MTGNLLTNVALAVFLVVVEVDVVVLFIDLFIRLRFGVQYTITRMARKKLWLGILLIGWQVLGAVALSVHLYGAIK